MLLVTFLNAGVVEQPFKKACFNYHTEITDLYFIFKDCKYYIPLTNTFLFYNIIRNVACCILTTDMYFLSVDICYGCLIITSQNSCVKGGNRSAEGFCEKQIADHVIRPNRQ